MTHDHDHSGDQLGGQASVESITTNAVTMRQADLPATYLVFPEGDRWLGMRTATQDVEFADEDGVKVVNAALKRLGETAPDAEQKGLVRVTAPDSDYQLESWTKIEHTTDGTGLIIEPNFWMRADDTEAITIGGDGLYLEFSMIRNWGTLGFRDLGLSNSLVRGNLLFGGDEGIWLGDAENHQNPTPNDAGYTYVHIDWARKTGVPYGIKMESGPDVRFANYRWRFPLLFGGDTAVIFGDRSEHDSVNNNIFYGDIDAASSGSDAMAEINDSHNGLYLKDYTPASGEQDIVIRPSAEDCFVLPIIVAAFATNSLQVQRQSITATDLSKFDPHKAEVVSFDLFPDSLAGYETVRDGNAYVRLHTGFVQQGTGDESDGWANLRRRVTADYDRLSFGQHGVLQTSIQVSDNADQRAWLLWGDREGPGVGWHIEDDELLGWVHDGEAATTVPLRTGFDPWTAWNLTAFYNPPTGIQYVVEETATEEAQPLSDHRDVQVEGEVTIGTSEPIDADASLSVTPTDEKSTAFQIMAVDLTNTAASDKEIRWTMWRNHHYPDFQ